MNEQTYIIRFSGVSSADANRYADELRNTLLDAVPGIIVQRGRDDPRTQDFGATLILILGTPTVVAATTAIGDWLRLRSSASITFETPDKHIVIENITSKNAVELVQHLLKKR